MQQYKEMIVLSLCPYDVIVPPSVDTCPNSFIDNCLCEERFRNWLKTAELCDFIQTKPSLPFFTKD